MSNTPNSYDDIIDSRDVIKRIEELRSDLEDGILDEDEAEELKILEAFEKDAEPYSPEWYCGVTLINDAHFKEYARNYAEEIGAIGEGWPSVHVDWEAAARALKTDFNPVEFDGVTFWVR